MSDTIHVDIVTPEASVFSGNVQDIRIPGWLGEFDILPGHDLYLSLVRGGLLTMTIDGQERKFIVGRGFAEAGPDQVTVLTDSCRAPEEADLDSAQADLDAAEAVLAEESFGSPRWRAAEEQAELARGRLAAR